MIDSQGNNLDKITDGMFSVPAVGESTRIPLIYYKGEVVKKPGFRKKPVAR